MELSNLLEKISHKEEPPKEFLALELTDDIVQAAVWHVALDITEVVAIGTPIPWNGDAGNLEDLVTAADTTITTSTKELKNVPQEVIFGIPTTWLDGESIRGDKKTYIKKICSDLELKPLGFVIVMDSLVRFLRMQEGTPATAVLIQVADTDLTIASVVLGKTHHIETLSRTDDVCKDVENGIASCIRGLSTLPSRFIVFDGMHDLEEVVQNLTLVDWNSKFPFLHIPKIEALAKDVVIRALCVAGGAEVARSIGFTIKEDLPLAQTNETEQVVEPTSNLQEVSSQELADLGFSTTESNEEEVLEVEETVEEEDPTNIAVDNSPKPKFNMKKLSLPKLSLHKFSTPFPQIPLKIILPFAAIVLIFAVVASSLWLFPKAEVTLVVSPKEESQEFTVNLDKDASSIDQNSFTIPASLVEKTVTGTETIEVTGTKTTGDASKGEVMIYNRTLLKKTFPKGTTITSGNLKFTLDEDVSVASKSAGADYVDVPGKALAKVTAAAIGEASNLASGTEFVIGNFTKDSYIAKNDSAFKGGSSRSVSAVSAKDKTNLVSTLKTKLEESAKVELSQMGGHILILPNLTTIAKESYSHKVGDEATSLEATLEVTAKGYSLSESDLAILGAQVLKNRIGQGYNLATDPSVTLGAGGEKTVNVIASGNVMPIIDSNALKNSLKGLKETADITNVLSTVPGFAGVKVSITPRWLPPRLKSLPRKAENITLTVVTN